MLMLTVIVNITNKTRLVKRGERFFGEVVVGNWELGIGAETLFVIRIFVNRCNRLSNSYGNYLFGPNGAF